MISAPFNVGTFGSFASGAVSAPNCTGKVDCMVPDSAITVRKLTKNCTAVVSNNARIYNLIHVAARTVQDPGVDFQQRDNGREERGEDGGSARQR